MKYPQRLLLIFFYICLVKYSRSQSIYGQYPVYEGRDLGLSYSTVASSFRIWSPTAEAARLLFYQEGQGGKPFKSVDLQKGENGSWFIQVPGDWKNTFYTVSVKINGQWRREVTDPYAKSVGINGRRAVVVDLADTDPAGWHEDTSPPFSTSGEPTDAIIYELHIRDASIHANSGITNKGKYTGLTEKGTVNPAGLSTGLDHLKELGVTHIHLLPFFDYNSVHEDSAAPQYNWGYDPANYNVPEGSYSTQAGDGITRIKELKQMVAAFHQNGLRVVMDVVYNHTALSDSSSFNELVPGYYYRHNSNGSFSNGTACGNETASELPMMRKFILESVLYWVKEYHIDGFRFDLMGVHDIGTMNAIADSLYAIDPSILLYGEGWTAGPSPLPDSVRAVKKNAAKLNRIAVFSDDIRDGIKGSVFDSKEKGFVSGNAAFAESVKFGVVASCPHPQLNYALVNYSKQPYAAAPADVITYCECHDNNTLWDKLALSNPGISIADRKLMHKLALTIVLTSQGIPFLHAGTEFMRSKKGIENSYNSGDSINAIDWNAKSEHRDLTKYVEQLIRLRKAHPAFRMTTAAAISENIRFDGNAPAGTVIYKLNGAAAGDEWKEILVAFNGGPEPVTLSLAEGSWINGLTTAEKPARYSGSVKLGKYSAVVLYKNL
jgi:pullulanase